MVTHHSLLVIEIALSPLHRVTLSVLVVLVSALLTASQVTRAVLSFDGVPYEALPPDVIIETVVPAANQLVAMDFTPDGRMLYTERSGHLQVVVQGQPPVTVYPFPVNTDGERGLLGVAVDPGFVTNHFVWVYFTKQTTSTECGGTIKNRVVRITLNADNSVTADPQTAGCFPVYQPAPGYYVSIHNGGNLHFGPDGKLYISVGNSNEDTTNPAEPAQNLASPLGKIHRYNPTMPLSIPADNPFANLLHVDKSNYAYGLRNPFDFTFDPISQQLFATDNGDKCDDEINLIRPGYNYGWRVNYPQTPLPCDDDVGPDPHYNTIPPLIHWTPSLAPTGLAFYSGVLIPEWKNDLFMCSYKDATTAIHHFTLNAARTAIVSHTILSDTINHQPITCRTDVLTGPEGALYYSEGGGYLNGPIKRLIRRTSFVESTATGLTPQATSGGQVKVLIALRHRGTDPNSVTVTIDTSSQSEIIDAQTTRGAIVPTSPNSLLWSSAVNGTETVTATYTLHIAATPTSTYLLPNQIQIDAPGATSVNLTPHHHRQRLCRIFADRMAVASPIGDRGETGPCYNRVCFAIIFKEETLIMTEGHKISIDQGQLIVPDNPVVPFIEGDGTGPDIWRASVRVMDAAVEKAYKGGRKIQWKEVLAGEKAFNAVNNWLPDETVEAFREYLVGIKGPLTTPIGGGIRSLNVALRQTARSLCVPAPGALVQRCALAREDAGKDRYGDLPREYRGHLRRHRIRTGYGG